MVHDKKETRLEEDRCDDCGSKNATYDSKLGEKTCTDCGLVDVNYSHPNHGHMFVCSTPIEQKRGC